MQVVWPPASSSPVADPAELVAADARPCPAGRPWVVASMVASADGSATDGEGLSGGLGGPADRAMFAALRSVADLILVGAGTVEAEGYGPSRPSAEARARRVERGQAPTPRIVVATASLAPDPHARLFAEAAPGARPVVLTVATADPDRRRALATVADVHVVGDDRIDWRRALGLLRTGLGASVVLCEGGPRTIGQLIASDLIDELCLTVAPLLAAGAGPRIASGAALHAPHRLDLARVVEADGHLLLRYVRARVSGASEPSAW